MITIDIIQKKISDAIQQSGITQTEIARKLNVKPTQISSYKYGRKMPALDTFAKLCAVLDVDANEILCVNEFDTENWKNKPE